MKSFKWIGIAAAVVAVGGVAFMLRSLGAAWSPPEKKEELPPLAAVRTAVPERKDMEVRLSYIGTVSSGSEVKIIARIGGTVTEMPWREGQTVSADTVLAKIDAPEVRAQVERLTAERDYWARRFESDQRLVEKNAIAKDLADADERSLKTTQAALNEAVSQLAKSRETAPFTGTVLSWLVEPGQGVLPGTPIMLFGSVDGELRVDVVEEDLLRGIRPGTPARVRSETGIVIRTKVAEVSPVAGGKSRTFLVKLPLPAGDGDARPRRGTSLRVDFILASTEKALTVPASAVSGGNKNPHVFLVRDGRALLQPVARGIETGNRVAVEFAWNGKDPVAVSNTGSLKDGSPVFPVAVEEAKE